MSLKKDGPIHDVAWIPGSQDQQYCVIYGFIPPIVSIFDTKGNIIFDFNGRDMKVNQICPNPWGTVVVLAGFGNLRGGVFVWDMKTKKQVAEFTCPETTDISWNPDGLSLLTATTAPRLRVGNGFKVWKYNGTPIYEEPFKAGIELYKICWQPRVFDAPKIVNNFKPTQVSSSVAAKYVPPSQREKQEYIDQIKEMERRRIGGPQEKGAAGKEVKPKLSAKEKQIAGVNRKLDEVSKLKRKQTDGTDLSKKEIDKLDQEDQLRKELTQLKLSPD